MADGSRGRTKTNGATQRQVANDGKIAEMVRQKHDTDSGLTPAQEASVKRWEREHTNRTTERVAAFGADGKVVYETHSGTHSSSKMSPYVDLKDTVITHNHPARRVRGGEDKHGWASGVGVSLSGNDLFAASHYNAKEMRAKANGYVYSIRRPEKGWPDKTTLHKAWKKAYQNAKKKYLGGTTQTHVQMYLSKGAKNIQDTYNRIDRLNAVLSHVATREIANKYGIKYTRSKA